MLDAVFGKERFINEIIWRRYKRPKGSQFQARKYGTSTDSILFYSKTDKYQFHLSRIKTKLDQDAIAKRYNLVDENGPYYSGPLLRSPSMGARPYLVYEFNGFTPGPEGWRMTKEKLTRLNAQGDVFWTTGGIPRRKVRPGEVAGVTIDSLWTDIEAIGAQAAERLGYPTQKPLALLERIINVSSDVNDVVLDPFCGCGTAIEAAQQLKRHWIGIDITHLAIALVESRLRRFPGAKFAVIGRPQDMDGARELAVRDKYQFQYWVCSLVGAQPYAQKKKGADGGIDGLIYFVGHRKETEKIIVSVKGGANVSVQMVRDLRGVLERENAAIGLFVTRTPATAPMDTEAAKAGFVTYDGEKYPRIQILTVEDLLGGTSRARHPGAMLVQRPQKRRVQLTVETAQGDLFTTVARGRAGEVFEIGSQGGAVEKARPIEPNPDKRSSASYRTRGRRRRAA